MRTKGQFILFTVAEFDQWLRNTTFSRKVVRVQNHHTLKPRYSDFDGSNHFQLLEGMKRYHVRNNGWSDIGQTLTTFPDGTVAVCRSFERVPACIYGANAGSVCIEHLGNFDRMRDTMTAAHRQAIVRVNALLCREFRIGVSVHTIVYHHWYDLSTGRRNDGTRNNKSCPGTAFFGGNKVADCEAGFLPLIRGDLERLDQATLLPLGQLKVVSADGLTVRAAPRLSGSPLTTLLDGTIVQIYQAQGIWRRIDPVEQRWVSSRYLTPA